MRAGSIPLIKQLQSISLAMMILPGGLALHAPQPQLQSRSWDLSRNRRTEKRTQAQARLSSTVSIQVEQSGDPGVSFAAGREPITTYDGPNELVAALRSDQAQAESMATADVDGDGVGDLICGYRNGDQGAIAVFSGNADTIYSAPDGAGQTSSKSPFLPVAKAIALPGPADFIGAGDFDNDGITDIVAATKGGTELYFAAGMGQGQFHPARSIKVPGSITAIQTGEVNRRDGLEDIVVAVKGAQGADLLVFEGPNGALNRDPETIHIPAPCNSLAIGQLDGDVWRDIAAGAGDNLVIVHGRDRKLTLDEAHRKEVHAAKAVSFHTSFQIASISLGDFTGKDRTEAAVMAADGSVHLMRRKSSHSQEQWVEEPASGLSAFRGVSGLTAGRVSGSDGKNLVLLNASDTHLRVLSFDPSGKTELVKSFQSDGEPTAAMEMRLNGDGLKDLVVLRKGHSTPTAIVTQASNVFTVGVTADGGPGSLRDAIDQANSAGGTALIQFSVSGGSGPVFSPGSQYASINVPMTIDGTTQSGGFVVVDGDNAGSSVIGLLFNRSNSLIRGVDLHNFHGFLDSSSNLHGGYGVGLNAGNATVENCFIGSDGQNPTPNAAGIGIVSSGNLIGGTAQGTGNLLSGNELWGLVQYSGADNNTIEGNIVGASANGQFAIPNGNSGQNISSGLDIQDSQNNTIAGNLISGNQNNGIVLETASRSASGNLIAGNFIGTDGTGSRAIGNTATGVFVLSSPNNTIGGTAQNSRNFIAGNSTGGVTLALNGASGNLVQNNFIGTNTAGNSAVGNGFIGVFITGPQNTIGGAVTGTGNLISATFDVNGSSSNVGVESNPDTGDIASGNQIQGNLIGTDITGSFALGSTQFGITVDQSPNNFIGGPDAVDGNLVSGHVLDGIGLSRANCTGNLVQANFVGTDVTGKKAVPNQRFGIVVTTAPGNTIKANLVSGNGLCGIAIGTLFEGLFGDSSSTVTGNFVGTDLTGLAPLPNSGPGIFVENDSSDNKIDSNTVAFNQAAGIRIPDDPSDPSIPRSPAVRIEVTNNLVFSNTGLGIDLGPTGPTPNPYNQTTGANLHQNFPTISSASFGSSTGSSDLTPASPTITVAGTMQASPNTTYSVQFFFGGNCDGGQGHEFLGFLPVFLGTGSVKTDGAGNGNYSFTFPFTGSSGTTTGFVNASATDPVGNTSEFSLCAQVSGTVPQAPVITSATVQGKNVVVTGNNFDNKAVVQVNGADWKTLRDASNPNSLIAKKLVKKTPAGTQLMLTVKNSDGTVSAPFPFSH